MDGHAVGSPTSAKTVLRVRCCKCQAILVQGDAPTPISDTIGPCCWAAYRAANGLKPRPYPESVVVA